MNYVNDFIKDYILYYSKELMPSMEVIFSQDKIATEKEAKDCLQFIELMCDQCIIDVKENKTILDSPASSHHAEKATMVIEDFIEDSGFDYLIDNDLELE